MKKIITLFLISFFVTVSGQVYADEYERIFSSENVMIDVRTPSEYMNGHLDKAVNIPYDKIETEIKYYAPNKEQLVVVYCQSGKRADIAATKLKDMGYTDVINAGKFNDLKAVEEKLNKSNPDK